MKLLTLSLGFYQANCYLFAPGFPEEREALVIDPGDDGEKIWETLEKEGLSPRAVLLTHGHWDHAGAAGEITRRGIPLYLHRADLPLVESWTPEALEGEVRFLEEGPFLLPLPGGKDLFCGRVIFSPGHTPGSVCLYFHRPERGEGLLFTGDTLFRGSVGRTDFPGGSAGDLAASLARLRLLPSGTEVYPGHGEPTTIGEELRHNPFFRDPA